MMNEEMRTMMNEEVNEHHLPLDQPLSDVH